MDVTPNTTPAKRTRTKAVAKEPSAAKPARKTLTTRKKSTELGATPAEATPAQSPDLHDMIATAAFYLAAERSFAPGRELDDWLEAERRIKALYTT